MLAWLCARGERFWGAGAQQRGRANSAAAAPLCLPLLPSCAAAGTASAAPSCSRALALVLPRRGERKGEPTVGLRSAELPAPILSSPLRSASASSAGAFSKAFAVVRSMG